jgi:hypothetical protein
VSRYAFVARAHRYAESNEKTGYYLYGHTPNRGHSTLQVHSLGDRLLDWLDIEDGDRVPQELLYAMLDTGLLYTESTETAQVESNGAATDVGAADLRRELTDDEFQKLLGFLKAHERSPPEKLTHLFDTLSPGTSDIDNEHVPDIEDQPTEALDEDLKNIADEVSGSTGGIDDTATPDVYHAVADWEADVAPENIAADDRIKTVVEAADTHPAPVLAFILEERGVAITSKVLSPRFEGYAPDQITVTHPFDAFKKTMLLGMAVTEQSMIFSDCYFGTDVVHTVEVDMQEGEICGASASTVTDNYGQGGDGLDLYTQRTLVVRKVVDWLDEYPLANVTTPVSDIHQLDEVIL